MYACIDLASSSAFAVGAVDEPAAKGGENTVPSAFFFVPGGVDTICLGAGIEGESEWCRLASDRTLSRKGTLGTRLPRLSFSLGLQLAFIFKNVRPNAITTLDIGQEFL